MSTKKRTNQKPYVYDVNWVRSLLNNSTTYRPHSPFFSQYIMSGVCFGTLTIEDADTRDLTEDVRVKYLAIGTVKQKI